MRFRGVHHVEFPVPGYGKSHRVHDRMSGRPGYTGFRTLTAQRLGILPFRRGLSP